MSPEARMPELPRLPTGGPWLDAILRGVRGGGRCLYMTLVAETHAKMMLHLSTLSFFDPAVVGRELEYLSGYRALKEGGRADARVDEGAEAGLRAAQFSAEEMQEFEEFLHELQAFGSIARCTTLLLSPKRKQNADATANVIADGVLELSYQLVGPRAVRELVVHKFRGTNFLPGRHEVELTSDGVQLHPRTEIRFDTPPQQTGEDRFRMKFGVERLDEMLAGAS